MSIINFTENKQIKQNFLKLDYVKNYLTLPNKHSHDLFGFIYCIENLKNHKKYIGSVYSQWKDIKNPNKYNALSKRASNYIYEYNKTKDNLSLREISRPIIKAIVEEGIENFIMYPIAETTVETHKQLELQFIKYFNTLNEGYNLLNASSNLKKKGTPHSPVAKKIRSTEIIAVHLDNKEVITADSMKLFGDYLSTSKDMIKNSVRKMQPYKGWFIFYTDIDKRHELLTKCLNDEVGLEHSKERKELYKSLVHILDNYLESFWANEYFPEYTILEPLEYINTFNVE